MKMYKSIFDFGGRTGKVVPLYLPCSPRVTLIRTKVLNVKDKIQRSFAPMNEKLLNTKAPKPKRKNILKVYLTDNEYAEILDNSTRAGLSLSTFAQKVCLGSQVLSREDKKARLELLKINSDLGRLGGLLKQAITVSGNRTTINNILHNISLLQEHLKAKVKCI